jgi:hypothetical protein
MPHELPARAGRACCQPPIRRTCAVLTIAAVAPGINPREIPLYLRASHICSFQVHGTTAVGFGIEYSTFDKSMYFRSCTF